MPRRALVECSVWLKATNMALLGDLKLQSMDRETLRISLNAKHERFKNN